MEVFPVEWKPQKFSPVIFSMSTVHLCYLATEQLKYQISLVVVLGGNRITWLWYNNWRSLMIHHIPIDERMLTSDLIYCKE